MTVHQSTLVMLARRAVSIPDLASEIEGVEPVADRPHHDYTWGMSRPELRPDVPVRGRGSDREWLRTA